MSITIWKNKIKRVAIFCDFLNSLGGTEFYNTKLGILLKKIGIDVRFYIGEKPIFSYWTKMLSKEEINFYTPQKFHKSLNSRELEKEFVDRINQHFIEWKPDIIHTHPAGKLIISWIEKRYHQNIPIVATEWTTPGQETDRWYQPELPATINSIDGFIVTCHSSYKGLINYHKYKGKIKIIPHLVPYPEPNNYTIQDNNLSIGCISRLSVEKGIDFLLGGFSKLNQEIPETTLHIYGHGNDKYRLQELVKCLGITNKVFFEGVYEPFIGINKIAGRHNIFVQPSLYESIPTSILELIARKRCVIATNVGGIPELFPNQKGGILIEKANTEEVFQKLVKLIKDTESIRNISNQAYNIFISKYDINQSFQKIISFYNVILANKDSIALKNN